MTSNSPAAMTEIQPTLLARGVHVLEAPVGGGVAAATQGTLQVLVGGDAEVFARQRDLLEILGDPCPAAGLDLGFQPRASFR
jgi:3-hydroxyisobutyrate dehydrogenase